MCMIFTKHSPLTRIVQLGWAKLLESGYFQYQVNFWIGSIDILTKEDPFSSVKIGIGHVNQNIDRCHQIFTFRFSPSF